MKVIENNQGELLKLGESLSKTKEQQKIVTNTPKRTILDKLESKNELLDKNLTRLLNDVNAVQSKLDKLNLNEPTHPIFNDYSFTDLQKMYMIFNS